MNGTLRIAAIAPQLELCNPQYNASLYIENARLAVAQGAKILVFAELALTGATCADLFKQELLLDGAQKALYEYVSGTKELDALSFIGLPVRHADELYNAVAAVSHGHVRSVALKPLFASYTSKELPESISFFGIDVPVSNTCKYSINSTRVSIFTVIGAEIPAEISADLVINPVCEAEYIGLEQKRKERAFSLSALAKAPVLIVGNGVGESGTDGICAAPRLSVCGKEILAESELFSEEILYTDIDFSTKGEYSFSEKNESCVSKFPFIPENYAAASALALEIQSRSLAYRVKRAYSKCVVIGVSGGLDSTLAVLVAAKAMDFLGYPRKSVVAITMPCFGTTERTKGNALALAEALGCMVRTIDIKASVNQHFIDISHDAENYNVVYENAQARERTQILMDVANAEGGLVVGTGDLSELALGFATYNGDHMSMYCVNGSVPKTLMRTIISCAAERYRSEGNEALAKVLMDIVQTPVSPELLPTEDGENKQHTESIVGPYELHDFFLYYTVKYGYAPSRVLSLAKEAFSDYNEEEIQRCLDTFVRRFFSQQFKRSCLPDGPRVTEISLSPRGAWSMPSDVSAYLWRNDLK